MAAFILVPGAWHGAWCWEFITPLLEAAGHQVTTLDLDDAPYGTNPLPLWAKQIATLAEAAPEPVILVGHSRGGLVISEAAELVPGKIRKLVYLSGFLLPAGESVESAMARPEAGGAPNYLRVARGRMLALAAEAVIPRFYFLAAPHLAADAASRVHPEPMGTFSAAATPPPAHIPRVYIECAQDQVVPLALQRAMQAQLPCAQVFTLPADHSPFLSMPEQLATTLLATL
ncbi:MAG: alpha/beta fold hydrolase [Rhodospirillales bacterium]|nr:alpha/beta fold hydrolase [Rhodospirillales bacterium]